MKRVSLFVIVLMIAATVGFAGGRAETEAAATVAEDCYPGELDERYCDRTGNLVADPPLDESQWVDPPTLVFAYAPVEDPAIFEAAFSDFLAHLENELARPVQWFGVRSYAAQIEAMRAGRLHVSGFSAGSVQSAVNVAGFVPMVMMAEDGKYGAGMRVIVHKDSDIQSVDDLAGREVAFVSESSNSGYLAPRAILYEEFDLLPERDYRTVFSGSHDNSILGVYNKDYESASVAELILHRMTQGGRFDGMEDLRVIYSSADFPPAAYGTSYNLHPDLQRQIKEAFLSFDWSGTSLYEEFAPRNEFVPVDYKEQWQIMRTIRSGSETVADLVGE